MLNTKLNFTGKQSYVLQLRCGIFGVSLSVSAMSSCVG